MRVIPHYHGDAVRALFVLGALILIVAESTGATLPLSTAATVVVAATLVIAAGITNPVQVWIHWVNACLAAAGSVLFGSTLIENYRNGTSVLDPSYVFLEALALLSLIALYFTTRTIRGLMLRPENE